MINSTVKIKKISAEVTDYELNLMLAYIKGIVNGFTIEGSGKWFSGRTLFGGKNNNWSDTPIQILYDRHEKNRSQDAKKMAGIDVGLLLLQTLSNDKNRCYETKKGYVREYREI